MRSTKYNNRKVFLYGQEFDSAKEARRYAELVLLEKAGQVQDLKRQVSFELVPMQRIDGKVVERPVVYVADFVYLAPIYNQREQDGISDGLGIVVEDVKGYKAGQAYRLFVIKRKLMLKIHNIRVKEV